MITTIHLFLRFFRQTLSEDDFLIKQSASFSFASSTNPFPHDKLSEEEAFGR